MPRKWAKKTNITDKQQITKCFMIQLLLNMYTAAEAAGYVSCKPGWLFLIKFHDRMLFFREHVCKLAADVEVLADKLFRNEREPLV